MDVAQLSTSVLPSGFAVAQLSTRVKMQRQLLQVRQVPYAQGDGRKIAPLPMSFLFLASALKHLTLVVSGIITALSMSVTPFWADISYTPSPPKDADLVSREVAQPSTSVLPSGLKGGIHYTLLASRNRLPSLLWH